MGRYTLTMQTFDYQTIKICFNKNGKDTDKVSLQTIDKLTITSLNQDDLLEKLKIDEKICEIKITYISNKQLKAVPVAYQDKNNLAKITMEKDSLVNMSNTVFISTMNKFLGKIEDEKFYLFAMDSDLLTLKQKEYIEKIYNANKNRDDFLEKQFKLYSRQYRQFRNILFLMERYEQIRQNENNTSNIIHEEIETYDPDDEHLYSPEEIENFNNYMDDLPDDILPDYIDESDNLNIK